MRLELATFSLGIKNFRSFIFYTYKSLEQIYVACAHTVQAALDMRIARGRLGRWSPYDSVPFRRLSSNGAFD